MKEKKLSIKVQEDREKPLIINGRPVSLPSDIAEKMGTRVRGILTQMESPHSTAMKRYFPQPQPLPDKHKGDVRFYTRRTGGRLDAICKILEQRQMLIDDLNMRVDTVYIGTKCDTHKDSFGKLKEHVSDSFEASLTNVKTGKSFTLVYSMGIANRTHTYEKNISMSSRLSIYDCWGIEETARVSSPKPLDILEAVLSDDIQNMSFEDWCDEFGYDSDSRSFEKIYTACLNQTFKFKTVFPHVDLSEYRPLGIYCGFMEEDSREDMSVDEQWAGYLNFLREWDAPLVTPLGFDAWLANEDEDCGFGRTPETDLEKEQAQSYSAYLSEWADDHADISFFSQEPASFSEWLENENSDTQAADPKP